MQRYGGLDLRENRPRLLPRKELGLVLLSVDANLLARIASLLSAQDMGRLAQTAARFSAKTLRPAQTDGGASVVMAAEPCSIVDDGARRAVMGRTAAQRARWPRIGNHRDETWLRVHAELERLERPPRFSFSFNNPHVELSSCGCACKNLRLGSSTVICEQPLMQFGVHRAQFRITSGSYAMLAVGLVHNNFLDTPAGPGRPSPGWATSTPHGWAWSCSDGRLLHYNARPGTEWAGQQKYGVGDVVELELDLGGGLTWVNGAASWGAEGASLTARKNGKRLGQLAAGSILLPSPSLAFDSGGYCWCVQFYSWGNAVRIEPCAEEL